MAAEQQLKLIDWTEFPSGPQKATEPKVNIKGNGQIALNSLASEAFKDYKFIGGTFDPKTRQFQIIGYNKPPKGYAENVLRPLGVNKKVGQRYFSASSWLRAMGYEFEASGLQKFACEVEGNIITLKVPKGSLTPLPTVPRKKRAKATAEDNGKASVAEPATEDEEE